MPRSVPGKSGANPEKRGKRFVFRTLVSRKILIVVCLLLPAVAMADCVVLLHGLARTARSMEVLEESLQNAGYRVANVDYPSREQRVEDLAPTAVEAGLGECDAGADERVHFVTHSMGGILVRYYLAHHRIPNLGRVVMLAPPNGGSEVVDEMKDMPGFELVNGPAGLQLGTGPDSLPLQLGAVTYPVGVIAGTRSVNPLLSSYLPDPDDGKVSVARTKVEGMADFIEIDATHPFIMRNAEALAQTENFLKTGAFSHDRADSAQ